jgi:outer membrane scaffolding protein for murein synthesis (MipA/OmpV family)
MRAVFWAVVMMMVASAVSAKAQQKLPTALVNDRAYTVTLMCAMVAATGSSDDDKVRTMQAARKMAKAKGHGLDRLSKDLGTMANVAGDRLRSNPNALDEDRAICRKLGLIG